MKEKSILLKCSCDGKCGKKLLVVDYGDKDCEIGDVYLDKKYIVKLIKYLNKIIL